MVRESALPNPTPGDSPPARTSLKSASPGSHTVDVGAAPGFTHVLDKERASRDHRGFAIALVRKSCFLQLLAVWRARQASDWVRVY